MLMCCHPFSINLSIWYHSRTYEYVYMLVFVFAGCFCWLHRFACSSIVVNMVFLMFFSLFLFYFIFFSLIFLLSLFLLLLLLLSCLQNLMDKIGFNGRMHCTRAFEMNFVLLEILKHALHWIYSFFHFYFE